MASTVPSPLARVLGKLQPGLAALLLSGVTSLCPPLGLPDTPRLERTSPPLLCKPPTLGAGEEPGSLNAFH